MKIVGLVDRVYSLMQLVILMCGNLLYSLIPSNSVETVLLMASESKEYRKQNSEGAQPFHPLC